MEFESGHAKLEETVIGILKGVDLEIATELAVRKEAERLLGVDLSDIASKRLVRRVVESFLLSTSPGDEVREVIEEVEEVQVEKSSIDNGKNAFDDGGWRVICNVSSRNLTFELSFNQRGDDLKYIRHILVKLAGMRKVSIKKFKETNLVSIREFYQKEGKVFPSSRGVVLDTKEWSAFRTSFDDIEEAITKMESRIRGEGIRKKQSEAKSSPHPLVPILTTRFTGRNYYCWRRQMDFFLNQLNISYVLFEPCPNLLPLSQKWMNDDYICRHTILNSLSDQLFDQYSIKMLNARETWEEINSVYGDDFGTKRCHVNNYIQFQMVDGVSVVEQVEELHMIAGAITASGIHIDENFHISAIISKLPPSWKHVKAKLMQEEHLPLDKLIYRLKDEEARSKRKDMRGLCFLCLKEGHIRRDCPLTRSRDS